MTPSIAFLATLMCSAFMSVAWTSSASTSSVLVLASSVLSSKVTGEAIGEGSSDRTREEVEKEHDAKRNYVHRDDHHKKIPWSETHLRKRLSVKKYTIRDDYLTHFSVSPSNSPNISPSSPSSAAIPVWRQLQTGVENHATRATHEFFSYYYPSPWSHDGKFVLQHISRTIDSQHSTSSTNPTLPTTSTSTPTLAPRTSARSSHKLDEDGASPDESSDGPQDVEIRVVQFRDGGEKHAQQASQTAKDPRSLSLGCSFSWSFAMGARLQWLGRGCSGCEIDSTKDSARGHLPQLTGDYSVIYNVRRLHPEMCLISGMTSQNEAQHGHPAQYDHPCFFMNIFGSEIKIMKTREDKRKHKERDDGNIKSAIEVATSLTLDLPFFSTCNSSGRYAASYNFIRGFALSNEGTYGYSSSKGVVVWEMYGSPNSNPNSGDLRGNSNGHASGNLNGNANGMRRRNNMLIPSTDGIWVIDVNKAKKLLALNDESQERFSRCTHAEQPKASNADPTLTGETRISNETSDPHNRSYLKSYLQPEQAITTYFESAVQKDRREVRKEYTKLIVTPRQLVDHLKAKKMKIQTGRQIGEWIENCFVWLEQPILSDYDERISFLVRAKCPREGEEGKGPWDLGNAERYQEVMSVTGGETKQKHALIEKFWKYITCLQESRYIDVGVFTVGIDGSDLWYGEGMPVSHFDFISEDKLLYCGNEGMAVISDLGKSPRKGANSNDNPRQDPDNSHNIQDKPKEALGVLYVSDMLATTQRADMYAGHCTFSRFDSRSLVSARGAAPQRPSGRFILPGRFILTDTSCTACTVQCPLDSKFEEESFKDSLKEESEIQFLTDSLKLNFVLKNQCPSGAADARYVAILDTETLELFRIGLFATDITVPEPQFVDLHPRFSRDGRFVMIDSRDATRHDKIAKQYVMDVSAITWRDITKWRDDLGDLQLQDSGMNNTLYQSSQKHKGDTSIARFPHAEKVENWSKDLLSEKRDEL